MKTIVGVLGRGVSTYHDHHHEKDDDILCLLSKPVKIVRVNTQRDFGMYAYISSSGPVRIVLTILEVMQPPPHEHAKHFADILFW